MAGYLTNVTSKELNLGDLLDLVNACQKHGLKRSTPVHIGILKGEVVLAVPVDLVKTQLPPTVHRAAPQPMKPARRGKR